MNHDLIGVLEEARTLGFLGPGPIAVHVTLAEALIDAVFEVPRLALDLGAGGGVPGLVLARAWPTSHWVLLDSSERRTAFLGRAVAALALRGRVDVVRARAEEVGRDPAYRGQFDLVVSRTFGTPPVTAECGAPFLKVGGRLVVTEPPRPVPDRWPAVALSQLGLAEITRSPPDRPGAWIALGQTTPCSDRFPRRTGVPAKQPLFPVARSELD